MGQTTSEPLGSEDANPLIEDPSYHFQLLGQKYLNQYQREMKLEDLDIAIENLRKSVDCMPEGSRCEEGVLHAQKALDLTTSDHPYRAGLLQNLGIGYRLKFTTSHSQHDLERAIALYEEACDRPEIDDVQKQTCLHGLADAYFTKHRTTQSVADLEMGFTRCQQLLDTSQDHQSQGGCCGFLKILQPKPMNRRRGSWLHCLATGYNQKYETTGVMENLQASINICQEAVDITPVDNISRVERLQGLGRAYLAKYKRTGEMDDLQVSLSKFEEALASVPDNHPYRPGYLHNLANVYEKKYEKTKDLTDLQKSIELDHESLQLLPDDHHDRADYLQFLGIKYETKFSRTFSTADLGMAGKYFQEAVDRTPEEDPKKSERLMCLALHYDARYQISGEKDDLDEMNRLVEYLSKLNYQDPSQPTPFSVIWRMTRYLRSRDLADLKSAINESEAVLLSTPEGHVHHATRLGGLGTLYVERYGRTGTFSDLDLALGVLQKAIDLTPDSHPDWVDYVNGLSNVYKFRYERSLALNDIDMAIQKGKAAINVTKLDHPDRIKRLYELGCTYTARYRRTETIADLNEGIHLFQQGLEVVSDEDPQRTSLIASLGTCYEDKHRRTKSMADINKSLQLRKTALDLTPSHDPQRFGALMNLGVGHGIRFQTSKDPNDLEDSLQRFKQALDVLPDDPFSRKMCLQNLAKTYEQMFQQNGSLQDLETAIRYQEKSIASAPDNDPDQAACLSELGDFYQAKYKMTEEQADIDAAAAKYRAGLDSAISPPKNRFKSGKALFSIYADAQKWTSAYEIARRAMDLVPLLTPRFLENADKQHLVTEMSDFAADAAAVALRAGQPPTTAIDLLEQGRGIISSSLNEMRRDLSDLENSYPNYASKLSELREELDNPGTSIEVDKRYRSAEMLDSLINEIRSLPGFDRFLLPPTEEEIKAAALHGPIVVLNASQYGCAALVVKHDFISDLQLSSLQHVDLHARAMAFTSPDRIDAEVLGWLWDSIACPVLDFLGIHEPLTDNWPRIWWIPIGALSKFPIHGAGYHLSGLGHTVLDQAISSYSSSIKALIHSRRGRKPKGAASRSKNVVLVGVEETPGQRRLPFTTEEVQKLEDICNAPYLTIKRPQPYREQVIDTLRDCDIFHFAGHGLCDSKDPSRSALLLGDGPLTVETLLEMNMQRRRPFLAYLSACGTGQIDHEGLINEGLHLIGACQVAGFQHVIGTLWQVDDKLSVDVAIMMYEWMQKHDMSGTAVSEGLHHTSRMFRDRWISGQSAINSRGDEKELEDDEENDIVGQNEEASQRDGRNALVLSKGKRRKRAASNNLFWVPYVHYGI